MSDAALGQALALASAVSFALSNIFISRTSRSGGDRGVLFSVVVTIALSGVVWLVLEGGAAGAGAPGFWRGVGWFAFAGLCAMVFGRSLLYASIRALGVTRSSAVKRLNPFFSVLIAALVLGEPITGVDGIGMAAIAAAFGLLIRESFRRRGSGIRGAPQGPSAYAAGVGSAFAYAAAYSARKLGLAELPSPAFGTLVSAVAGLACFAAIGLVSAPMRANLRGIFTHLDRWIVLAALLVSAGQILLFAALAHEDVSTVVMIASLEIFIAMFLSVAVFRTEPMPGPAVLAAAGFASLGVVLVAV